MDFLTDLSGPELVALASIFSFLLSQGLTSYEIDTLGNFFTALGTNLTTIAAATPESIDPIIQETQK